MATTQLDVPTPPLVRERVELKEHYQGKVTRGPISLGYFLDTDELEPDNHFVGSTTKVMLRKWWDLLILEREPFRIAQMTDEQVLWTLRVLLIRYGSRGDSPLWLELLNEPLPTGQDALLSKLQFQCERVEDGMATLVSQTRRRAGAYYDRFCFEGIRRGIETEPWEMF